MMQDWYEHLEWDSREFGFPVARITCRTCDNEQLRKLLDALKTRGYRMVYWTLDINDEKNNGLASLHRGFLAARNITYVTCFEPAALHDETVRSGLSSSVYQDTTPNRDLEYLAVQSGVYSRFYRDPLFPRVLYNKLYILWITRSVAKEIAQEVRVVEERGKIVGLITLGRKAGRGDIGLLAVDPAARRKHIAKTLVLDGHRWFIDQGFTIGQVATQRANVAACRLYEACGYRVEQESAIYHFWL